MGPMTQWIAFLGHDRKMVNHSDPIRINVPPRYLVLAGAGSVTGLSIGLIRGARAASSRFLAENVHRAPTTVQGWYFYKKTKNYKVMLGGLREGGRDALRLGAVGLAWAGLEDAMQRIGLEEVREVGAGIGTAGLFSGVYRLPMAAMRRSVILGGLIGAMMCGLRWGQHKLKSGSAANSSNINK